MAAAAVVIAALAIAAAGCGSGDEDNGAGEAGAEVAVQMFAYQPDPIEVDAGTTVTWTNEDNILHTVTSGTREEPTDEFDLELAETGDSVEHTFDEAGGFDYICSVHNGMDGRVVVR